MTNADKIKEYHFREIQKSGIIKRNIHEIDFGDYQQDPELVLQKLKERAEELAILLPATGVAAGDNNSLSISN